MARYGTPDWTPALEHAAFPDELAALSAASPPGFSSRATSGSRSAMCSSSMLNPTIQPTPSAPYRKNTERQPNISIT
eukprot:349785-Chlamydomonas_euryale.AAC.11